MGAFSIWHWLIVMLVGIVYFVPMVKILNKAGYSGWYSVIVLIPLLNILALWMFAFSKWPNLKTDS